jgi:hypothetical protein
MRRFTITLLAVVLILPCRWILVALRTRKAPAVGIIEIGYVKPSGIPAFTISNLSAVPVLRSQWCSIQRRTPEGKIDGKKVWLESGALLPPHLSETITLVMAPTQGVWSVAFEASKWGVPERFHLCPQRYHPIRSRWIHQDERELLTSEWSE